MRGSYQTTPDTVQNASAEKTRVWVLCALKATRKQLADEKLEWPGLFKEALLEEYRERRIYEKSPSSIVVELEHPHFLYKDDRISHKLPQEVSTFEFEKTESGTLSYGKEPPRPRWHGQVPIPRSRREDRHAEFCRFAAWIRALAWWCEQLEDRLQPPSTSALLRPAHEPVVKQEPQQETDKRLEPTTPAQVSVSKPKTEEAPRESRPEVQPPSQPGETTGHKDAKHAKGKQRSQALIIGGEVHALIPRCRDGLTRWRKLQVKHPSAEHICKGELRQQGFKDTEIDVLTASKTPESAACRMVAQKHPEMKLKTVQNNYSAFKDS